MCDDPIDYPIDGTLDLHQFRPQDVKSVLIEYLQECRAKNILKVRVVHGKGIGTLRTTVHHTLKTMDYVKHFNLAGQSSGSWGATWVHLLPLESS